MRRKLLLLLGVFSIFLRASSQPSEPRDTFVGNLLQKYNETVSRNIVQNYACSRAPVGSYYSSHYAAVDINEHPEACGRCLQATCVDRTQCRSPFLNVTVVVIDDCPGCGEGAVAMNSLAVRELTGRSLETEEVQVEWTLFECSATTEVSVPPPPSPRSPPPPAPAPPAPAVVVLATPAPEEELPLQGEEVKAAPASSPAVEENTVVQVVPTPSPEVEERVEERVEELVPVPETELLAAVAVEETAVPVPAPELEVTPQPQPQPQPSQSEMTPATTPASDLQAPSPEQEPLVVDVEPLTPIPTVEENVTRLSTVAPPAPYPPPPPPQAAPQAAVEEEIQKQQEQAPQQENNQQGQQGEDVETEEAVYGLPGDDVLTLPRVGRVGLAIPFDYQPFPKQAFANIACGFASVSTHFKTHFAGMSSFSGQNENACGSCLAVRCADPSQCPYGTETVVQIVDTCQTCGVNGVNISPDALKAVMWGENFGSGYGDFSDVMVTWRKVPCRSKTEGSMYLHVLNGATDNEYYAQMSLSNAAQEIAEIRINGQSLTRMTGIGGGRWEWQNNGNKLNMSLPAVLEVTGMDGKVMKMELQKFESQELPSGGQL